MNDCFKDNEYISSLTSTVRERLTSTMYGSFIIAWCLWNWKFILMAFFTGSDTLFEATGKLKIDLLVELYKWNSWIDFVFSLFQLLLFPATSVIVFVWILSKLDRIVHKKHCSNVIEKDLELMQQQERVLKKEKSVLEKKEKNVQIEKNIELTNEEKWEKEYKKVRHTKKYKLAMSRLKECLYNYNGKLEVQGNLGIIRFKMSPEHIAYLHVNEIIDFADNSKEYISTTHKGKYFLKKYIQGG